MSEQQGRPSMSEATLTVAAVDDGQRVDRYVAEALSLATRAVRRLCDHGDVRTVAPGQRPQQGRRLAAGDRVTAGQVIAVAVDDAGTRWFGAPPASAFTVLHEDEDLIVVDKAAGIPCHPLRPREGGTLADALVACWPELATASPDPREAGLLHRLDNGTSGCLAFARSLDAWQRLRPAVDEATKTYLALLTEAPNVTPGTLRPEARFVIETPLKHDPRDRRRMIAVADATDAAADAAEHSDPGLPARTVVSVLDRGTAGDVVVALAALDLAGGRRHQLRAHCASVGLPLLGDALYGAPSRPLLLSVVPPAPFFLHARTLVLAGRQVKAPLPEHTVSALTTFALRLPTAV